MLEFRRYKAEKEGTYNINFTVSNIKKVSKSYM